jgi:hypothetical protein
MHLTKALAPSWGNLISALECEAGVNPPNGIDFAARLDIVQEKLGRAKFQRQLRLKVLQPTASALIKAWEKNRKKPPSEVCALAHLGFLVNPIVNFNIETLSSQALMVGSGPWHPVVFHPPVADALSSPRSSRSMSDNKRHQRRVYHPHGAIDISGICVMTEREYQSMQGTLGLELAVHAAFGLDLAIVGMSLEDHYLRDQLEKFRNQIDLITWFVGHPVNDNMANWAYSKRVEIVESSWTNLWYDICSDLPGPEPNILAFEWLQLVIYAYHLSGQPMTDMINTILNNNPGDVIPKPSWVWKAILQGEDFNIKSTQPISEPPSDLTRDLCEVANLMSRD